MGCVPAGKRPGLGAPVCVSRGQPLSEPLRIVVSGYYGCGNLGDEAVLAGILLSFRLRFPAQPVEFTVLSANPEDTVRLHGVRALPRMSPSALRHALRRCHLFISGGGSLFQDATSLRSLLYYAAIAHYACRLGRPVMLYAQGIGPLRRGISRRIVRGVANRAAVVTVRDEASRTLLREIGVERPVEVTADPAFVLPIEDADPLMWEFGLEEGNLLGFALRPWRAQRLPISGLVRMIETASLRSSGRAVLLPLQHPDDLELAERIAAASTVPAVVIRRRLAPREGVALVARMQALAAMRLHALIFGAMGGVPSLALAYDPKVEAMAQRLGQSGRCIPLHAFDADAAGRLLAEAAGQHEDLRRALLDRSAELAREAVRNADLAMQAASAAQ